MRRIIKSTFIKNKRERIHVLRGIFRNIFFFKTRISTFRGPLLKFYFGLAKNSFRKSRFTANTVRRNAFGCMEDETRKSITSRVFAPRNETMRFSTKHSLSWKIFVLDRLENSKPQFAYIYIYIYISRRNLYFNLVKTSTQNVRK